MKFSSKVIGTTILIGTLFTAGWGFLSLKDIEAENPHWNPVDKTSYVTSFGGNAERDRSSLPARNPVVAGALIADAGAGKGACRENFAHIFIHNNESP